MDNFLKQLNEKLDEIINRQKKIEKLLVYHGVSGKDMLDFNEALDYLKISKSKLYKLTHKRRIEFFKPEGKKLYFSKATLDKFLQKNKFKAQKDNLDDSNLETNIPDFDL
ncbi:MAG TPA: DNA-binding protein [Bacteroidales bacterium]|nr:MAG: binding domain protein, excisionase family protein [candidate division TM6 bacterium GW2011_GWF2_33_332]OFY78608.1 MAG: hypothetical protein A2281_16535 [Bacteroidetes bacterium RIFOXYA12_FULL_38_20]HBS87719.1 DNA-binding protein [Bacteroidales bacterium]